MNTKTKATINDVAVTAKVSKKTVSRVINNESGVSDKMRTHVQKVINELNYSPDPQARGLAFKRSYLLALIYDNPNADFVSEAMHGVLNTCQNKGYELVVHPCIDSPNIDIEGIVKFTRRIKIDGVVLLPPLSESEELIKAFKKNDINYVRLLSHDNERSENLVQFDDNQAIEDVVEHLVAQGHTNIGFIKGTHNSMSAKNRYQAFSTAMKKHQLTLSEHYVQQGSYTFRSGEECGRALLSQSPAPTAIFASNDEMALGVIAAANKLNVVIPDALALVGFDDSPHSSEITPALTTVNVQVRKMAGIATKKLLFLCNNQQESAAKIDPKVTSKLIIRASTTPSQ